MADTFIAQLTTAPVVSTSEFAFDQTSEADTRKADASAIASFTLSQNAPSVNITGGSITGITDLAIADGGTGASDAATARTNLGLGGLSTLNTVNTAQIDDASVTFSKVQDVNQDKILGRQSVGSGDVEEITCTSAGRNIIGAISPAAQRIALGVGGVGDSLFQANTANGAQQSMDVEVGVDVQAYNANTVFTNVQQTFTAEQNFSYTTSLVKIGSFSGTTYTPVVSDGGKLLLSFNATGSTFTIPAYASVPFPVGTTIAIVQYGTGQVTVSPGGGVALLSKNSDRKTAAQYSSVSLLHFSTNNWLLVGDLTA